MFKIGNIMIKINFHCYVCYIHRTYHILNENFLFQPASELTYAELTLTRPNSLEAFKSSGNGALRNEPTIYAQIDHGKRPIQPPVKSSPIISPASSIFTSTTKPSLYHREVVTVRTPLMGCQQESCV